MYVNNNPYKYTDPDGEFIQYVVIAAIGCARSSSCRSAVKKGINTAAKVLGLAVVAKEGHDLIKQTQKGIEASKNYADAVDSYMNGDGSVEDMGSANAQSEEEFFNTAGEAGDVINALTPKGDSTAADIHTILTAPDSLKPDEAPKTRTCDGEEKNAC
jgi:hypothetical protein